ncbi:MAG: AAA family ATPase [Chlamydiae bacterium]|nr:AAA family ATPase [Chlamydiota bacterium]
MLKELYLKNIFLFEEEKVHFENGLNILTGETGSGKSNILKAINLLLGEKIDQVPLQKEVGVIEGFFDIDQNDLVKKECKREEIEITGNILNLRREFYLNKKSRFFINDELASISLIKEIGGHLIEFVSQNSSQELLSSRYQLNIIDLFSKLNLENFLTDYNREKELEKELFELLENKKNSEKETLFLQESLKEINELNLQKDEEEKLNKEHTILTKACDILQNIDIIYNGLQDQEIALISKLKYFQNLLNTLTDIDPSLNETKVLMKNALLELEEVAFNLRSYKDKIEIDPQKVVQIEERLSQIFKIKKKYGSFDELLIKQSFFQEKLTFLLNLDEEIKLKENELKKVKEAVNEEAKLIHDKRKKGITLFEKGVLEKLRSLNLENGKFKVDIKPKERSSTGDDEITFLFTANLGQELKPLKFCASAGELSRIMLVIKTLLSKNDQTGSIIFDEIDANIGGKTATIIGEKLKELAQDKQIICVTHFVQVAKFATNHLYISKLEKMGQAKTKIEKLSDHLQEKEFNRMIGLSIS